MIVSFVHKQEAKMGAILREDVFEPLGLSITAAAAALGVSRKTLSKVLNGRGAITAEMAMRLELAFGKPRAEHWLKSQAAYDLHQARTHKPNWPTKCIRWLLEC